MFFPFLSAKSCQTSKSKISNKYLKPFPRDNTLKSVALAVALSVCSLDLPICRLFADILDIKYQWNLELSEDLTIAPL